MGVYLCHVTVYTYTRNDARKSIKSVIVNYYSCLWVFIYVM